MLFGTVLLPKNLATLLNTSGCIQLTNSDILKFILGSEAWGNIAEPEDDFFCFISPSLAAKYEV